MFMDVPFVYQTWNSYGARIHFVPSVVANHAGTMQTSCGSGIEVMHSPMVTDAATRSGIDGLAARVSLKLGAHFKLNL